LGLKIRQCDVARMLKELELKELLKGKLELEMDLKGRGQSVAALMAGLNGKTVVSLCKGQIHNRYIDLLGADLGSAVFRLLNPFREKEKTYTMINCFVSRFDIKDGIARSSALVLDTNSMSVVGQGKINLKTEALNLALKPLPKKGIGTGITGKLSLSLGELAKPFKLGGTLASPSLTLDPTQTAIAVGKALRGVALFGPAGIAAALVSSSSGDENPCLSAIEASKKGVKARQEKKPEEKKGVVRKATEGVGGALKKLFGK